MVRPPEPLETPATLSGLALGRHYLHVFRLLVRSRLKSQISYRASFIADLGAQVALMGVEFIELFAVLGAVPLFAGFSLPQAIVLFGMSAVIFAVSDLIFGEIENFGAYIRQGKAEVLLLRPLPMLLQVISNDLQVRRITRFIMGLLTCGFGAYFAGFIPSWSGVLVLAMGALSGVLVFGATFILSGAIQFWLIDSKQLGNLFVYGSNYVSQFPAGALYLPLRVFFTYVIPIFLSTYAPVAYAMGVPLDPIIPTWLVWCSVPCAGALFALALWVWQRGIRHYEGAGG